MILAIIQARMGSTRLPGKILKEILGQPLLLHLINRLSQARKVDKIVVATTSAEADNPVEKLCREKGHNCFRGSENDVLDRFYQAALASGAGDGDAIVRITGDCPLLDPEVVDGVIGLFVESGADYASNVNPPTYPDGLDVEVFAFTALETAWRKASLVSEREHVTPFLRNNPQSFKQANLENNRDLSDLRWTVDEEEDFAFVNSVYEKLYTEGRVFKTEEVVDLLMTHPELISINNKFKRNEGFLKSLQNDRIV